MRFRARSTLLVLVSALCAGAPRLAQPQGAGAEAATQAHWSWCNDCQLFVGAGTTYSTYGVWRWTGGFVLPITLEIDDSRWELGAFRFATRQHLDERLYPAYIIAAHSYWGFSAMRRWQVLHRGPARFYLGFGGSYKTETDLLTATRGNFALLLAIRFDLGGHDALELSARHWSNARIRLPDRGQNFITLSLGF